ncbi:hypothetical protein BP5796_07479 [Coleophoma crateriformis]|uniref:Uncharacterized protein n=1 Tax=Coleophoma crateriformis TaxID=565419 RepID=A0A3D8RJ13_9HELO|nr:hypothetical protein BP5796_07479 [Coleophoma crateriformis]
MEKAAYHVPINEIALLQGPKLEDKEVASVDASQGRDTLMEDEKREIRNNKVVKTILYPIAIVTSPHRHRLDPAFASSISSILPTLASFYSASRRQGNAQAGSGLISRSTARRQRRQLRVKDCSLVDPGK